MELIARRQVGMGTRQAAANRGGPTHRVHRVPIRGALILRPHGPTPRRAGLTQVAVRPPAGEGPIQEAGRLLAVRLQAVAVRLLGVLARVGLPDPPATAGVPDLLTDATNRFSSTWAVFLLGETA